jgi:hypothetical protein
MGPTTAPRRSNHSGIQLRRNGVVARVTNRGKRFKRALYSKLHRELVAHFGGLTAHARSPAHGLWTSEGSTKRDDMIIMEVMTKRFDRTWWKKYRRSLEKAFRQQEIVIRVHNIIQV